MSEPTQEQADLERVKKALSELGEHFDSVQIFTTRHEPGSEQHTVSVQLGCGNYWAREGQVRAWLTKCEEGHRIDARKDREEE